MGDNKKVPVVEGEPVVDNFPDVSFVDLPDGYSMVSTIRYKFAGKHGGSFSFNQAMKDFDNYLQTARNYMIKKFANHIGVNVNFAD